MLGLPMSTNPRPGGMSAGVDEEGNRGDDHLGVFDEEPIHRVWSHPAVFALSVPPSVRPKIAKHVEPFCSTFPTTWNRFVLLFQKDGTCLLFSSPVNTY